MFKHCIGISKDKSMFALVQICGVLSSRGTCYPHVRCISIYTCRKYIYIILVIRIELYLLLLLLKWLKMGDWNEQIVDPVLPSVNDIVKIEQNTHAFCKTYNASNLCKGRSIIRPEFSMSLRSMFKVYAVLKFKNNILINSESLLKESYYHTQMQSLCTS